jgi:peptidoglycan/xylan/chitin deacetylase (PgdA/CDA1 family)
MSKGWLAVLALVLVGCGSGSASPPPTPTDLAVYSLNFDDGYESAYVNGLLVVEAAGYKTTQFIITGNYANPTYVTQGQVLQMSADGHEIAAHTRTHPHLPTLTAQQQQDEIQGGYQDLCGLLRRCPQDFAYPYGDFDATSVSLVQSTGYLSARTTRKQYDGANANRWELAAYALNSTTQFSDVQAFVDGVHDQKVWAIIVIHRVDETGGSISITHQLLQQIVDYLKQKNATVVTQSEGLHLIGLQ